MTTTIVKVNEGKVRGIKMKSKFSGVEFYAFFEIPYGQPTGGPARFKDPEKVKPWRGILDATTEKKYGCLQFSLKKMRIVGEEDCLYNNIYTSQVRTENEPLKPVLVIIHPGANSYGSPSISYYGSPNYIMNDDIVFVGIAFRLHILGALNLNLKECSGNQQLKDIILSLEWIKENISAFGGDPGNITLIGSSAGAMLVHALMLSPRGKGLFHKAVLMGKYLFSPVLHQEIDHQEAASKVAQQLQINPAHAKDNKRLLGFFKKPHAVHKVIALRPARKINENRATLYPSNIFTLTVDKGDNAVLSRPYPEYIKSMVKIPLMLGVCEKEVAGGFVPQYRTNVMNSFYETYRNNMWGWGHNITDNEVEIIKEKVNSVYFKNETLDTAPLSLQIDIQSHIAFSSVYKTLLDVISADLPSSVFVYKFEFEGHTTGGKEMLVNSLGCPLAGTIHADDYNYFIDTDSKFLSIWKRKMVQTFCNLLRSFAKTGNPNYEGLNVEWRPSTPEEPCFLRIKNDMELKYGKLYGDKSEFWEDIIEQFGKI